MKPDNDDEWRKILESRHHLVGAAGIARELGCAWSTVARAMKRLGIEPHPKGHATKGRPKGMRRVSFTLDQQVMSRAEQEAEAAGVRLDEWLTHLVETALSL